MDEVSNQGAVLEETPVQQEAATPQAESNQETIADTSEAQNKSQPDQQDKSWVKKLRRDRDDAIRREQEANRKIQMQEELFRQLMANQAAQQPSQAKEDILQKVQRQEYVAGEDVAMALQQQREEFQQQLQELKKQSESQKTASMFADLKREFTDFDEVVNPDTLALLDETYPRLAQSIAKSKDPYDAALLAYETIKAKGLTERVPDARRAKEVEKRLEQNKKTIQTPQAYEKRPMAQAFRMPETKQEKQAVYNEMLKYASMAGGGY